MLALSDSILSHNSVPVYLLFDFIDALWVYRWLELVFSHVFIYLFLCLFKIACDEFFTDFAIDFGFELVKFPVEFGLYFSLLIQHLKRHHFDFVLHLHILFDLISTNLFNQNLMWVLFLIQLCCQICLYHRYLALKSSDICHQHC